MQHVYTVNTQQRTRGAADRDAYDKQHRIIAGDAMEAISRVKEYVESLAYPYAPTEGLEVLRIWSVKRGKAIDIC